MNEGKMLVVSLLSILTIGMWLLALSMHWLKDNCDTCRYKDSQRKDLCHNCDDDDKFDGWRQK